MMRQLLAKAGFLAQLGPTLLILLVACQPSPSAAPPTPEPVVTPDPKPEPPVTPTDTLFIQDVKGESWGPLVISARSSLLNVLGTRDVQLQVASNRVGDIAITIISPRCLESVFRAEGTIVDNILTFSDSIGDVNRRTITTGTGDDAVTSTTSDCDPLSAYHYATLVEFEIVIESRLDTRPTAERQQTLRFRGTVNITDARNQQRAFDSFTGTVRYVLPEPPKEDSKT